MGIVINNYLKQENKEKVNQILTALTECDQKNCKVMEFDNITKQELEKAEYVILSGSSASLRNPMTVSRYEKEIHFIRNTTNPLLGICFGHQLIGKAYGSKIKRLSTRVDGFEKIQILEPDLLFSSWEKEDFVFLKESHEDVISLPEDFIHLAWSRSCEIEAMKHTKKPVYSVQAHIERFSGQHIEGKKILQNFLETVINH